MTDHVLKPPFTLHGDVHIEDAKGHVCTVENKGIAQTLLALLNRTAIPATTEPHRLTIDNALDWIELALLRVRDNQRAANKFGTAEAFGEAAEHLAGFRKEHREQQ
jgi:hypothetical protein